MTSMSSMKIYEGGDACVVEILVESSYPLDAQWWSTGTHPPHKRNLLIMLEIVVIET